jgi:hypothetical protein
MHVVRTQGPAFANIDGLAGIVLPAYPVRVNSSEGWIRR